MRRCFPLLLLLCICAAAAAAPIAPFELKPPAKPQADLWLEGEEFVENHGGSLNTDRSCYGGKCWGLLTKTAGEYSVKYKFTIPTDGFYSLQIAGQPVGREYTSPIWYAIDGGSWVKVTTLPASEVVWGYTRAVRWTALGVVSLEKGEHTLAFKIDQVRSLDKQYAYIIDAIALKQESDAMPDLRGKQPANVFTTQQQLAFEPATPLGFGRWQWRVVDWQGSEKLRGNWEAKAGILTLPQLDVGYYRLQLQDSKGQWSRWLPFAVVLPLEQAQAHELDIPYAMDSAQSWLASPGFAGNSLQPAGAYELISDLEALGGFSMIRERLSWSEVNPQPGVYRWGRYATNADLLSERGISVLGMFHNAPQWTKEGLKSLPHDLLATYEFCKAAAKKFSGQMTAWEFWNEPDLMNFNQDPSWDLAAAHKAAYLGFKAGDPNVDVLIASNCVHPAPKFFDVLMQNGVGDYMDSFNFHVYAQLDQYQKIVEEKRQFLSRHGQEAKPMWVTENGLRVEGTGKEDPIVPGGTLREHDREQELAQAELMVKAQITMQALGVARDFSFVFPPYNEGGGGKAWGIFRWDYTVKPAYAALANLIRQLGDRRYQGKLDLEGISAFLYAQPDGGQILVYWADSARQFTLAGQGKQLEMLDFLGGSQTLSQESGSYRLSAGRFPSYLKGLSGLAPDQAPLPKAEPKPSQVTDLDTVLRVDLGKGFKVLNRNLAELEGTVGNLTLDLFNFSDKIKTLTVENMSDAYQLLGMPKTVTVPAMGKASVPLKLLTRGDIIEIFDLKLRSRSAEAVSAPVVIPVTPDLTRFFNALEAKEISGAEPERWEKNSSGDLKISFDKAEKAVRFDVAFAPNVDHWVYPVFRLRQGESREDAVGLSFEVKAAIDSEHLANPYKEAHVMAVLEDELEVGKRVDFSYNPTTEWEKVDILFATEAPPDFNPASVKLLRIGLNPRQHNLTYWVRNLKVYYQK